MPRRRRAYREALARLEARGIVEHGRLTKYGRLVEATPVERPWAELLVQADDALVPMLAVMAAAESLHRMTREDRNLEGLIVPGSDHLTAYNVYADALAKAGYVGEVYGLPRHVFDEGSIERWAERRGVLIKAIEDTALAMASVCRSLEVPLPAALPLATDAARRAFTDLVARVMPFDLVIDEETAAGEEARVSKTSVCGSWGAIAGSLRFFADRFGVPRASIEGTQLPMGLVRRHAAAAEGVLAVDREHGRDRLLVSRRLTYHGFELERDEESADVFPAGREEEARAALALALARGEARHPAVRRNSGAIEEIRELHRRSGGRTPRLSLADLAARYEALLANATRMEEYRALPLHLDLAGLVPPDERRRLLALPSSIDVRGQAVPVEYDLEERNDGAPLAVARLRLPEKLARSLAGAEVPALDRPLRFVVFRGARGAVRAASLDELQELLRRPWSPAESEAVRAADRPGRGSGGRRSRRDQRPGRRRRR